MLIRKIQKNKKKNQNLQNEVGGPILSPKQHFAYK
jgi:hypothetical protein